MERADSGLDGSRSVYQFVENVPSKCKICKHCNKRKRGDHQESMSMTANGRAGKRPLLIILDSEEEDLEIKQPPSAVQENVKYQNQDKDEERMSNTTNSVVEKKPLLISLEPDDKDRERMSNIANGVVEKKSLLINLDPDDEDEERMSNTANGVVEKKPLFDDEYQEVKQPSSVLPGNVEHQKQDEEVQPAVKEKNKGLYLGVVDDFAQDAIEDSELGDIWTQMTLALEVSKDVPIDESSNGDTEADDQLCDHSYILKDDIGYVCRVYGIIDKPIDTILDIQYKKPPRYRRYSSRGESRNGRDDNDNLKPMNFSAQKIISPHEAICAHPRHLKQMKPHQKEGFNFLHRNLMDTENPGGCILAHAPGSGKTFMIISFIQSFLAKHPNGRPLIIMPKGILSTWKKEFQKWQIENTPLLDFYSCKAENRKLQLQVLLSWKEKKSILFLGYKQFSTIVSDMSNGNASKCCKDLLLHLPNLLIMDEGHTPRNKDTDIVRSLAMVEAKRKVILSGTLYQNSVKEVFTLLNLVRPRFMRLEASSTIRKRIMTYVDFSGFGKQLKGTGDVHFYELVENTLKKDNNSKQKASVIKDLRELTSRVLHYYKGDFLDELPGLVDFTVLLKPTPMQKMELDLLMKAEKNRFSRIVQGSIMYVHPKLKKFPSIMAENEAVVDDENVDELLQNIDVQDGVKAKFFLNMLGLCEAANEKLLVFGQYLLPLKFLERLIIHRKGWKLGKEIFMISGDHSTEQREWSMENFNNSSDAKVFFGSIKACGEGISLVGASRIIILDVHVNPSVSRQAIGRAFRPGQLKKVYTYRLVAADSPEVEDHNACYKKELISKRWFERNDYDGGNRLSQLEEVDLKDSGDVFLDSPALTADVKLLLKR